MVRRNKIGKGPAPVSPTTPGARHFIVLGPAFGSFIWEARSVENFAGARARAPAVVDHNLTIHENEINSPWRHIGTWIALAYSRMCFNCFWISGGREGIRTPGLLVANEAKNLTRRGAAATYAFNCQTFTLWLVRVSKWVPTAFVLYIAALGRDIVCGQP